MAKKKEKELEKFEGKKEFVIIKKLYHRVGDKVLLDYKRYLNFKSKGLI